MTAGRRAPAEARGTHAASTDGEQQTPRTRVDARGGEPQPQKLHTDLFSLQQSVRAVEKTSSHRSRLDRIERIIFPCRDQYVECSNLASSIDHTQVQEWFQHCGVRRIFRRRMSPVEDQDAARSVLVWIKSSTEASTIDAVVRGHNSQVWDGRQPVVRWMDASVFIRALEEEGDPDPHNVSPTPGPSLT